MAYVKTAITASALSLLAFSGLAAAQTDPNAPVPPGTAPAPAPAPTVAPAPTTATATATVTTPPAGATTPVANPDLGDPGAFVVDQVSGFRGRVGGGVSYYGPLGVAYNTFSTNLEPQISLSATNPSITTTETTINSWSVWFAPSLDYFLVKNVSIGGLFAVDASFGSAEIKTTVRDATGSKPPTKSEQDLPTVTSFTLMPRVGYFLRINDRLSFWPRFGMGYFSGSNARVLNAGASTGTAQTTVETQSVRSLIFQLDIGLIYQITDNVFFRAAPAVSFSTGGTGTLKYKNAPPGTNDQQGTGSAFQFELTSGFGANFSL